MEDINEFIEPEDRYCPICDKKVKKGSPLHKCSEKKLKESSADMIIANDVGSIRYKKNPQKNQIIIVDSKKNIISGWMSKEKIAKLIRKQIEVKIK